MELESGETKQQSLGSGETKQQQQRNVENNLKTLGMRGLILNLCAGMQLFPEEGKRQVRLWEDNI